MTDNHIFGQYPFAVYTLIMEKVPYVAKVPDSLGYVNYDEGENVVWQSLFERQLKIIENRACSEFYTGVKALSLNGDAVPQLPDVSKVLTKLTGWQVVPVKALISFKEFFELLRVRKFPAATFIRRPEEMDYLKEPDIFHEIFGHCTMLTHKDFADFTHKIGEIGANMSKEDRVMLARLYWFTVEFGLIDTKDGLRIYGGGILSSKSETIYALESGIPLREEFNLLNICRTPYRYDEMQKKYFIINSFAEVFKLVSTDLKSIFKKAKEIGLFLENQYDIRSC